MKNLFEYICSDYQRYTGKRGSVVSVVKYLLIGHNHCFNYSFWFRLSSRKNLFYPLARLMHRYLTQKYGIQIPRQAKIGYGLYIGHGLGMVINPTAIIGDNCNLSQFLTIGSNHGKAATIGNNVYIGPSVCIVEDVRIGNNVSIGAGAVVTKDIPDNATVAGVPAKILNFNNPGRYVNRRYQVSFDKPVD